MKPALSSFRNLRTLLILGRVSNLPTVWSNCLAAWLLSGGGSRGRFVALCFGSTLFYVGGMFLNDAVDSEFDARFRPERPIPSGQIAGTSVKLLAGLFFVSGWLLTATLGYPVVLYSSLLVAAIVLYDFVHKHTSLAPVLMSSCRFLLYLLVGVATMAGLKTGLLLRAFALAAYVLGLSYLARAGATPGLVNRWPIGLLMMPILIAPLASSCALSASWGVSLGFSAWIFWCLGRNWLGCCRCPGGGVPGLLAGIVLVDWLAVAGTGQSFPLAFIGLFLLALGLQRICPAD